ncbi:hypothetical protein F5884DRAFT_875731 [Xylogone sp. PMI_703]|nr:hypothetical protein F5884DRAFT_875731 [Xylogone sp. PMI_703]
MNVELPEIEIPDYPSGSYNFIRRLRGIKEPASTSALCAHLFEDKAAITASSTASSEDGRLQQKLNIVIIGAGVGGLSNSIALRRMGHNVNVYEQANALSEIGAGIQIPPNSARILHSWGLKSALERRSVVPKAILWKRWENGSIIGRANLNPESEQRFGSPYYVTHRAHLHEALHSRTQDLGVPIWLQKKVKLYNELEGSVTFEDGEVVKADLIVAADGLKSLARSEINGTKDKGPFGHGLAAYRATVDIADIEADPLTKPIAESRSLHLWVGDDRHVMSYAIAGGESYNLVLTHPYDNIDKEHTPMSEILQKMRSHYNGWDPVLCRLLEMVTSTVEWPINQINIPENWASKSSKIVLSGDAAHAMVPYMALGAAMAVEDAAALAASLKHVKDSERDLPNAISKWIEARKPRVQLAHAASYGHGLMLHIPDGPVQQARDDAMRPEVEGLPVKESPNQWTDPTLTQWAYGHDPVAEVERLWHQ